LLQSYTLMMAVCRAGVKGKVTGGKLVLLERPLVFGFVVRWFDRAEYAHFGFLALDLPLSAIDQFLKDTKTGTSLPQCAQFDSLRDFAADFCGVGNFMIPEQPAKRFLWTHEPFRRIW
jgi:hypothetical protein